MTRPTSPSSAATSQTPTKVGNFREATTRDYKTTVIGAVKRGWGVRLKVKPDTEAIFTDGHSGYLGIADHDTRHETVNHSAGEYVRADVHTNTVEGVWSLFKRSIIGSYHQISAKQMGKYLSEEAFRFENRRNPYLFRDALLRLLESKALAFS